MKKEEIIDHYTKILECSILSTLIKFCKDNDKILSENELVLMISH